MKTKITNVYILKDNQELLFGEILFDEHAILAIDEQIIEDADVVIDGEKRTLLPGLIDVHVHLREPGNAYKETIATGTRAAAKGGFTTIMAMPNVIPYPDDVEIMQAYQEKIQADAVIEVLPYACITKKEQGKEVVDMQALCDMGIRAFSDDGVGVADDAIMEQAMQASAKLHTMIVAHTEDMKYRKPLACMHEGERSAQLGYIGIPSACESEQLKRDLQLVEKTHAHYHVCHMSAKESVVYLKAYKAKGLDVSGEVTAHHLLLCDRDVQDDANYKMNPPLRSKADQEALLQGLLDGTIDMIANDHAPHSEEEKQRGMEKAPFGIVALETAFPLLYTYLVKTGKVTLQQLVYWMSEAPAKRFWMDRKGKLSIGYASDMILVDLEKETTIDKHTFASKGKNTPFDGWKCNGMIQTTIKNGTIVYETGKE